MIEWSDSLSIGIKSIDEQHKELFKRVRNLLEACKRGAGIEEAVKMFDFLEDYTITHFFDEEKSMRESFYPQIVEHKKIHIGFKEELGELKALLKKEGPGSHTVVLINKKVVEWLISHIGKTDKAFGEYLRNKDSSQMGTEQ